MSDRGLPRWRAAGISARWAVVAAAPTTVATVLFVALAARTFAAERVASPWIMIDELTYSDLARSFVDSGSFALRGHDAAVYSVLYPILIAPAWLAHSMDTTYAVTKAVNALLVTMAGVPLYLWARRLVSPAYALLALLLFLLLPCLLYAGTVMTENAALPAFLVAALLLALALERPTLVRQALVLVAVGVMTLIRLQGLVLVAVVATAVAVSALLERRTHGAAAARERLVRFWPTFAALVAAGGAYAVTGAIRGTSLHGVFGAYGVVATADYSLGDSARWVVRHFAELGFAVALVPVAALIVLLVGAVRAPRATTAPERAFLAVAIACFVSFPVQSGVFASHFAQRVEERAMMYVEPLLLLALVLWLARGAPRPRVTAAVAAVTPVLLLFALPLGTLLAQSAVSDTFGLVPLLMLRQDAGMEAVSAVFWFGAALLAGIFAAAPRPVARVLLPLGVGVVLAVSSAVVGNRIVDESLVARAVPQVGDDLDWIDHRIGRSRKVAFLYTASADPQAGWQIEFWNRSVHTVLRLGAVEPGGIPGDAVSLDDRNGRLVAREGSPAYVVVPRAIAVVGEQLAERGPWSLYRAAAPLRLESALAGTAPDGWMGKSAVYTSYRARAKAPSAVEVVLSRHEWGGPDIPGRVRVVVRSVGADRAAAVRTGVLHSSQELRYVVPAPREPFRILVSIEPTFSPADFGLPDERQLGAIPSFRLLGN